MAEFGYAGKILRVDLSSGNCLSLPTADYANKFLGGRGIAAKIYWDETPPEASPSDAQNRLIFATGPLCGMPVIAGSRWVICGRSPGTKLPGQFSYCNLGGDWGAELKFAGYDALAVHGKADRPVYVYIEDGTVEIRDASALWGKGAIDARELLKNALGTEVKVAAIGPAGEHGVVFATVLADHDASGSGGMGAVMGAKNLKAVVVRGTGRRPEIAQPERFGELTRQFRELKRADMRMSANRYESNWMEQRLTLPGIKDMKMDRCYGCFTGCRRLIYETQDGRKGKFMCDSAMFYQPRAEAYYGAWNDVPFLATKLCDNYGLDSWSVDVMISWLHACFRSGVLNDQNTGLPLSRYGSQEFIEAFTRSVSLRQGFGDLLAQGLDEAVAAVGAEGREQLKFAGHFDEAGTHDFYSSRLYSVNALLYAMEPRPPIQQLHEMGWAVPKWVTWLKGLKHGVVSSDSLRAIARRWFGSELAVDFSTWEGKALAACKIQDREYAKESLVLCDFLWPIREIEDTEDHVGDPALESKVLSAVTGNEVDEEGLNKIGERIFNLQRAILVREGHRGRAFDRLPETSYIVPLSFEAINPPMLVPGKGGEPISRKGAVVDRVEFEKMKEDFYQLRRWDVTTGLQTRAQLEQLGLEDVAENLNQRGLLGG